MGPEWNDKGPSKRKAGTYLRQMKEKIHGGGEAM